MLERANLRTAMCVCARVVGVCTYVFAGMRAFALAELTVCEV